MKKIITAALTAACFCLCVLTAFAADTTIFVEVPASHALSVSVGNGGAVLYDGVVHTENFTLTISHNGDAKLILRADSGKTIERVLFSGEDISEQVQAGVLELQSLKSDAALQVFFAEAEKAPSYTFTVVGTITRNGEPVSGVTLELRSRLQTFVTGADGKYRFDKVAGGHHTLTALKNGKVVGYVEFVLSQGGSDVAAVRREDGSYAIEAAVDASVLKLNFTLQEDGGLELKDAKPVTDNKDLNQYPSPQTGDSSHAALLALCSACTILLLAKRRKSRI